MNTLRQSLMAAAALALVAFCGPSRPNPFTDVPEAEGISFQPSDKALACPPTWR